MQRHLQPPHFGHGDGWGWSVASWASMAVSTGEWATGYGMIVQA
jgi:hypothetical protein